MIKRDERLFWALLCSILLHGVMLALKFADVRIRAYPSPLMVTLPMLLPTEVPASVAGPSAPDMPVPARKNSSPRTEVVELTPHADAVTTTQVTPPGLYLPSSQLAKKPHLLNPEWLDEAWTFPAQARGDVTVVLYIGKDGAVDGIEVDGAGSEFADWIRSELPKRARFLPGESEGIPVGSKLRVRLNLQSVVHN